MPLSFDEVLAQQRARGEEPFEGWAILELMGHRRLGGRVSEQKIAGVPFVRIDVPGKPGTWATQFYGASSVYCLTPTTEEVARALATREQPSPVHRWELASGERPEPKIDPYDTPDDEDAQP